MSEPLVFLMRTPVRNVPPARAWSPAPSGRVGAGIRQTGNNLQLIPQLRQGLQGAGEFEILSTVALRPPRRGDRAVRDIDESHPYLAPF